MTAASLVRAMGPVLSVAVAPPSAHPLGGDDLAGARDRDLAPEVEGVGKGSAYAKPGQPPSPSTLPPRDYFAACHTVAPPAPYIPVFGPHRGAHLSLAAVVAGAVYGVEGRV